MRYDTLCGSIQSVSSAGKSLRKVRSFNPHPKAAFSSKGSGVSPLIRIHLNALPFLGLASYQWLLYFSSRTITSEPRKSCSWLSLSGLDCCLSRRILITNSTAEFTSVFMLVVEWCRWCWMCVFVGIKILTNSLFFYFYTFTQLSDEMFVLSIPLSKKWLARSRSKWVKQKINWTGLDFLWPNLWINNLFLFFFVVSLFLRSKTFFVDFKMKLDKVQDPRDITIAKKIKANLVLRKLNHIKRIFSWIRVGWISFPTRRVVEYYILQHTEKKLVPNIFSTRYYTSLFFHNFWNTLKVTAGNFSGQNLITLCRVWTCECNYWCLAQ